MRRPLGKARKRRNMDMFRGLATPPGGMHRRPKWEVIFAWALRSATSAANVYLVNRGSIRQGEQVGHRIGDVIRIH